MTAADKSDATTGRVFPLERTVGPDAPRVEAVIADAMARYSTDSKAYYEAVHQCLAPLARSLEIELRRDAARLDWLADRDNPIGNVQLPTACVEANLTDMRRAIDAAMVLWPNAELTRGEAVALNAGLEP